jgi:hypothetical protein
LSSGNLGKTCNFETQVTGTEAQVPDTLQDLVPKFPHPAYITTQFLPKIALYCPVNEIFTRTNLPTTVKMLVFCNKETMQT